MNTFLDLVYSLIVTPRAALYDITRGERLREAGILWLFTIFLTAVSAFSEGPGLLVEFLAVLLFSVFFTLAESIGLSFLSGIGSFVICVWTFVLDVLAIRENYFFSTGKSVLIAIAPYVMLLLFLLLLAMIGVFAAVAGLSEMEEMQELGSVLGSI